MSQPSDPEEGIGWLIVIFVFLAWGLIMLG
jgi:hypothetical protein